ncbi:hypothetical protein [Streptomyces sp. Y1]|uniref:Serine/arginine repetitive matrix protein 2 n=1 Tax=Streptomyces sp. Y1 TaxID=3238634 RepID=A0AB39TIF6_9ACTN
MGEIWDAQRQQWVPAPPPPPPLGAVPPPVGAVPPPLTAPLLRAPAGPRPTPPPDRPGGRRRPVLVAALVGVLLGAVAGGGGWYLYGRHDDHAKATATPLGTPLPSTRASDAPPPYPEFTFPATPSGGPTPTATPTPSATPTTGLHTTPTQDAAGFTLPVPDGWQRRVDGTSVFYDSPDGNSLIQVFSMGGDSPYAQATSTDSSLAADSGRFPGYRRLRLDRTPGGGAVLEYSYDLAGRGVRHTVDQIVTGPDGQAYALLVAGPETSWPTPLRDVQASLVAGFCLSGHCPATPAG